MWARLIATQHYSTQLYSAETVSCLIHYLIRSSPYIHHQSRSRHHYNIMCATVYITACWLFWFAVGVRYKLPSIHTLQYHCELEKCEVSLSIAAGTHYRYHSWYPVTILLSYCPTILLSNRPTVQQSILPSNHPAILRSIYPSNHPAIQSTKPSSHSSSHPSIHPAI